MENTKSYFTLGDYNDDGYVDIYYSSYAIQNSTSFHRLLINNNGSDFHDQAKEAGINHSGLETAALFGDYDNDGYLDLYIVKDGPNLLYKNNGNGVFSNVADKAHVDDA